MMFRLTRVFLRLGVLLEAHAAQSPQKHREKDVGHQRGGNELGTYREAQESPPNDGEEDNQDDDPEAEPKPQGVPKC